MRSERSFSHVRSAKACLHCILTGRTPRKARIEEEKLFSAILVTQYLGACLVRDGKQGLRKRNERA